MVFKVMFALDQQEAALPALEAYWLGKHGEPAPHDLASLGRALGVDVQVLVDVAEGRGCSDPEAWAKIMEWVAKVS